MELRLLILFAAFLVCVSAAEDPDFSIVQTDAASRIGCPVSCFRTDPVCGTNGVTYWCGAKDAACDGVQVSHGGFCNPENGVAGGKGMMAGQALLLVHLVWLMLAGVLVLLGIP